MPKRGDNKEFARYYQYLDLTLRAVPVTQHYQRESAKKQSEADILKKIGLVVVIGFVGYVLLGNLMAGWKHRFQGGNGFIVMHEPNTDSLYVRLDNGMGHFFTGTFYDNPDQITELNKTVVITPFSFGMLKVQSLYSYNNPPNPIVDFAITSPAEGYRSISSLTLRDAIYLYGTEKVSLMKSRYDLNKPVYFVIQSDFSSSMLPLKFSPPTKFDNDYR